MTRPRVEPHLIARTGDRWYLIGWCQQRDAPRWFRWDRIESAALTTEPAPPRDPALYGTPPPDAHAVSNTHVLDPRRLPTPSVTSP